MRRRRYCLTALVLLAGSGVPSAGGVFPPVIPVGGQVDEHAKIDYLFPSAAVASDHPVASEAGREILALGGNAVDAAVATAFCLSVVRPYSCGIGGGGFMVIYEPAQHPGSAPQQIVLNYRETAPAAIGPDYYVHHEQPLASRYGVHAVGIPGEVAGLLLALKEYGTLGRKVVLAPAIRAAHDGFLADIDLVRSVRSMENFLSDCPVYASHALWIRDTIGHAGRLKVGDLVQNVDQAKALELIVETGVDAFYRGPIAEAVHQLMAAAGGPLTIDDLNGYEVVVQEPLRGTFGDYDILCMPPPSSGGIALLQSLGILERLAIDPGRHGPDDPVYVHAVTESLKHAFADRATWLADDRFVHVPRRHLLSDAYLDRRAAAVRPDRTRETGSYGSAAQLPDDDGTSHFSIIDDRGMAVSCTSTINTSFGSFVVVPGFGFVLNNEMDDFTTIPGAPNAFGLRQSTRNLPEPGKRPLSSMAPTIMLQDGKVLLVAGASGGPRIISSTLQVILNCVYFDMTPGEAVARGRFHHQWLPDILRFEGSIPGDELRRILEEHGHTIEENARTGVVQVLMWDEGGIRAASDPRKGGRPAGY